MVLKEGYGKGTNIPDDRRSVMIYHSTNKREMYLSVEVLDRYFYVTRHCTKILERNLDKKLKRNLRSDAVQCSFRKETGTGCLFFFFFLR